MTCDVGGAPFKAQEKDTDPYTLTSSLESPVSDTSCFFRTLRQTLDVYIAIIMYEQVLPKPTTPNVKWYP